MHNPLYRLHWVIEKDGTREEHYSFHIDDSVVADFIREVGVNNTDPNSRYLLQGGGKDVSAENGRIYDLIRNSKKLGFWDYELKSLQIT